MGVWTPGPGATSGSDVYEGDGTNENVDGLGSGDTLRGRGGSDTLIGNTGNDHLAPGNDFVADIITGGDGFDTIDYSEISEDGIYLDGSGFFAMRDTALTNDTFTGIEQVIGTQTGDVLAGVEEQDVLVGGGGNDFFIARNAQLTGGAGRDFFAVFNFNNTIMDFQVGVDFITNGSLTMVNEAGGDTFLTFSTGAVFQIVGVTGLTLAQWQAQTTSGWFIDNTGTNDSYTGFGSAEYLFGAGGDDTLNGSGGDDTIYGGPGADTLSGGTGVDLVDGGSGNDVLIVNDVPSFAGEILSGGSGTDTVRLVDTLATQQFVIGQASISSIERLEFGSTTGSNAYAYISQTQFGAGFSTALNVVGSALTDQLEILMSVSGTFSIANFTFTTWGGNDLIVVGGTVGVDNIIGSTQRDWLVAGAGNDTLTGGDGDDDLRGMGDNDSLFGGEGADWMQGDAGDDSLLGNNGDDTLIGGDGADFLGGGGGTDTARYLDSTSAVTVNLQTNTGTGGYAQGDTYGSIETVTGSDFGDTLTGRDFASETLIGMDGDDVLVGLYGGDVMHGGNGVDTLSYTTSLTAVDVRLFSGAAAGGEANGDTFSGIENIRGSGFTDTLAGDAGSNQIWGGAGNETITGREGDDFLYGEDGNDTVLGGAGEDYFLGSAGNDTFGGGADNDTVDYSLSGSAVTVNLQTGVGSGGQAQGDTLVSIENVFGSSFNDVIIGKNNAWDNRFDGVGGNDTITGGLGNDTFVYRQGDGSDTITDFMAGGASGDRIEMTGWGAAFDTFGEAIAVASQVGADVVFNFGGGQTLTLQNVTLGAIDAGDFVFA